jgi:hypothetical protein
VEEGYNTSIVALRVVGGNVGTQCLGVQLGHPVPGGYKYGRPGPPDWGSPESETLKYGHESRGTRTPE